MDHQSDVTRQTKQSKKSTRSNRSGRSNQSIQFQKYREHLEVEKTVDKYKKEKNIEEWEKIFDYATDEESMYGSFAEDAKQLHP